MNDRRWRNLHIEEHHNLYFFPDIRMRLMAYVACMGEMRNAYNILVGNPEGRTPLRRPGHR
jgi:hypothetical protein